MNKKVKLTKKRKPGRRLKPYNEANPRTIAKQQTRHHQSLIREKRNKEVTEAI